MASTAQVYPGATRAELHKYLDRTYGRQGYLLTRDDEIHVLGPLPWAPEHTGWYFLEHASALCRPARHRQQ